MVDLSNLNLIVLLILVMEMNLVKNLEKVILIQMLKDLVKKRLIRL